MIQLDLDKNLNSVWLLKLPLVKLITSRKEDQNCWKVAFSEEDLSGPKCVVIVVVWGHEEMVEDLFKFMVKLWQFF